MYYTYMWSLVIAKDLLTPFEKSGLLATDVTARYRDTILAAGGTKDAKDLVRISSVAPTTSRRSRST